MVATPSSVVGTLGRLAFGLVAACLAASSPAAAAPVMGLISVPQNTNACLRMARTKGEVDITSTCGTLMALRCGYVSAAWDCELGKVNSRPEFVPSASATTKIYVGACHTNESECIRRLDWLMQQVVGQTDQNFSFDHVLPPPPDWDSSCDIKSQLGECMKAPRG
jgi:hypothetical protein